MVIREDGERKKLSGPSFVSIINARGTSMKCFGNERLFQENSTTGVSRKELPTVILLLNGKRYGVERERERRKRERNMILSDCSIWELDVMLNELDLKLL